MARDRGLELNGSRSRFPSHRVANDYNTAESTSPANLHGHISYLKPVASPIAGHCLQIEGGMEDILAMCA